MTQLASWGNGQRPVGWSIDLQPLQDSPSLRGTPAPFSAVMKVKAPVARLHVLWLLGICDGGSAYTFQSSFVFPPVRPILRGLTRIDPIVLSIIPSLGLRVWMVVVAASSCFMVRFMSWRTSMACVSGYVRFSMVHIYDDAGGAKGMAKKVISDVGQQVCSINLSVAWRGREVTR
jgi:hypothetical protein